MRPPSEFPHVFMIANTATVAHVIASLSPNNQIISQDWGNYETLHVPLWIRDCPSLKAIRGNVIHCVDDSTIETFEVELAAVNAEHTLTPETAATVSLLNKR